MTRPGGLSYTPYAFTSLDLLRWLSGDVFCSFEVDMLVSYFRNPVPVLKGGSAAERVISYDFFLPMGSLFLLGLMCR